MSDTGPLFLDERLEDDLWIKGRAAYPPLMKNVAYTLNVVASGLCISQASLQWAFYDAVTERPDENGAEHSEGFKRLRKRLLSPPVKMVTHA